MEYQADGSFWLDPNRKVRGRLTFSQDDGGELRLEGILAQGNDLMREEEVIEGTALDGTELCLLDTFPVNLQIASKPLAYPHRFYVNRLLVGTRHRDQTYETIRMAVRGLLDFTARSGLAVEQPGNPVPDETITINWKPDPDLPSAMVDDVEISLVSEHRFTGEDYEFHLEHRTEVELRGPGRLFDDWEQAVGTVAAFVAFCLGWPVWIERLYAPINDHQVEEIFQHRESGERPSRGGPWITLDAIGDEFDSALEGWFAFAESDREAFEILVEYLRFGSRLLLPDRLLYLARVIEFYHRGGDRFEQVVIPKADHRGRKKEIIEAAPEEHREWLTEALARSNDKTLRERITELVESFEDALTPIVRDAAQFATIATDNRNYFTHYSAYLRENGRVAEGIELHWLVLRLLLLVRACVLREMGFGNEAIAKLLRRDRNYDTLVQQN